MPHAAALEQLSPSPRRDALRHTAMSDETNTNGHGPEPDAAGNGEDAPKGTQAGGGSGVPSAGQAGTYSVSGMYREWFLDYASYVILERAVPALYDGLKPVQRRILHAMDDLDDGRYNKVANIIGHTMQYHPHG